MPTDRRTLLAWAGTVLLVALCLWPKSLLPRREESPRQVPHADKVIHFAMFAGFSLLWMRARRPGSSLKRRAAGVAAAAACLAVATEILQGTPGIDRDPDVLDALADSLGGLFGVALVLGAGGALGEEADEAPGP